MCRMTASSAPASACPQCGADVQPTAARCWLCGWSIAGQRTGVVAMPRPAAGRHEAAPWQFSIAGLLIVTTVVAVCLGAFRVAPGLGVLLVIFLLVGVAPAVIRARAVRALRPSDPQGAGNSMYAYVESFAVTAGAMTVGVIAFGVVAFVAFFIACADLPGTPQVRGPVAVILLFASPVIGLIVTGIIYWAGWPHRRLSD
jgi:hypothetical protein